MLEKKIKSKLVQTSVLVNLDPKNIGMGKKKLFKAAELLQQFPP